MNEIVGPKYKKNIYIKSDIDEIKTMKLRVSQTPISTAIDSGACDSIIPPSVFTNTPIAQSKEMGRSYGACGGEEVVNLGTKKVKALTKEGKIIDIQYQVGDKITRPLTAVSQLAAKGMGVWFGPGPKFESYIVQDPRAFVAHNGQTIKNKHM